MAQQYDFDRVIDRRGTGCVKFDFPEAFGKPADALPLWVADMDFQAPPGVLRALAERVNHGIFGYSDAKPEDDRAVTGWFERRFGWPCRAEWLVRTPGVVFALAAAVRALTRPGDAVLVQPPVYYPFYQVVRANGRKLVENPLLLRDGRYEMDLGGFETAIVENNVKLFILCSPHNPVGRVWTPEELRQAGDICRRHGVLVASDEIHCDFTWPGHPHTPFPLAVPDMADRAIVCTAPSKTFNLAGLQCSNIFIPDPALRRRVQDELKAQGASGINCAGLIACRAAYETGEDWLEQLLVYLRGNLNFLRDALRERLPALRLIEPEGTYLAWVDCAGLDLAPEALEDLIVRRARLWLDAGPIFGTGGEGFQRIVLACPRATLREAIERLSRAVDEVRPCGIPVPVNGR